MITNYFVDTIKAIICGVDDVVQIKRELFTLAMAVVKADTAGPKPVTGRYILRRNAELGSYATPYELYFLDGKLTGSKIAAIKYVRAVTGMGLKDAKDYVEALPVVVEQRGLDL